MNTHSTSRIRSFIEKARERHAAEMARLDSQLSLASKLPDDMPPPDVLHLFPEVPWLCYQRSDYLPSEWPTLPRRVDILNYWLKRATGVSAYKTGTLLIVPMSVIEKRNKDVDHHKFLWHIHGPAVEVRFDHFGSHSTVEVALYAYVPCDTEPLLVKVKVQPFGWTRPRPHLVAKLARNGDPIPGRAERVYPDLGESHRVQWASEFISASYFYDEERARNYVLPFLNEAVPDQKEADDASA